MTQTILVIDDKTSLTNMVREYLEHQGYRIVTAHDGRQGLYVARHEKPDLILLDIMMPEMDGYEFIRTYRRERTVPIILLTARLDETDRVLGLELGADDYITKPFSMAELVARVRAVLRRAATQYDIGEVIRVGGVTLDLNARTVAARDVPIDITATEFTLLRTLMMTPGRTFSRIELMEAISNDSLDGVEGTVNVHIHNLRRKIEDDPSQPRYILTVYGMGYRFATDRELEGEAK